MLVKLDEGGLKLFNNILSEVVLENRLTEALVLLWLAALCREGRCGPSR